MKQPRWTIHGDRASGRRSICLVLALAAIGMERSAVAAEEAEKETDPRVLEKLERFQDWKFGFMMHWGIYSQWGCIESWPLVEKDEWARPGDLTAWVARGKDFDRFSRDYRALNQTFHPRKFEPRRWAAAAKAAGMKYVVFTTKHHDGFCLFDTRQTDYRTTHPSCPMHADPQADVVKAVFDAFRKQGFGIGAYYSKSDWHHPAYWTPQWPHPDRNVNYDTRQHPEIWAEFVGFTRRIVEELMTGYGPVDILWLDGGQVRPPRQDIDMPRLAAMARRHQPGLLIVDRTVGGHYENYRTPEQQVPKTPPPFVWETCMTMGDQWSYKPGDKYKSTHELIHLLVDIVAKGGNFLLNVGPDADGELPAAAVERLSEIGWWMKVNGAAIYGTRAVPPYRQGPVCLTKKGDTLYAILLAGENETRPPESFVVPGVRSAAAVRMLGVEAAVSAFPGSDGLVVRVPAAAREHPPCEHAWAFEIIAAGVCCSADLSATASDTSAGDASAAKPAAEHAPPTGNLLRNAGFELDSVFNGSSMRQGTEFMRAVNLFFQNHCPPSPCEGWWIEENSGDGVSLESKEVRSGSRAIQLEPPEGKRVSLVSAPEVPVPAGPLVLSAWVHTTGAKALLELQLVAAGARSNQNPYSLRSLSRRQMALPENTGPWSRVTLVTDAPVGAAAVVRLVVQRGRVVADDLQLEAGRVPTPFAVRPEERLRLAFEGTPESRLPCWVAEDDTPRKLLVRNGSNAMIDGDLEIWAGPWSQPKREKLAALKNVSLGPRDVAAIPLRLGHLKPDAYVVAAVLVRNGKVSLDGSRMVDPAITIGGRVSGSILKSRAAIRFALAPRVQPARIFGVGNGVLTCGWRGLTGSWFGGWPLGLFAAARPEGFVCGRGRCPDDDTAYLFAAAGVPLHRMESQGLERGAPAGASFEVPGAKGGIDLWNPQGMALMKANAAEVGKVNAQDPLIVSYQMAN